MSACRMLPFMLAAALAIVPGCLSPADADDTDSSGDAIVVADGHVLVDSFTPLDTLPRDTSQEATDCIFGHPDTGATEPVSVPVAIAVIGLAPPFGARQMTWDVDVRDPEGAMTTTLRMSATGDGTEEMLGESFVTHCDPTIAGEHVVRVLTVGVYADPVDAPDDYEGVPPAGGMSPFIPEKTFVSFKCRAGGTARVITAPAVESVYADGRAHGVYDLAVVFGDLACHAELECCQDTNGDGACDGDLSWYPPLDDVDWSVIRWRFYCFALAAPQDPPTLWRPTEMFLDDVVIDCGDAGRVAIDPTARQGAPYCDGFGGGATPPSGCVGISGAETGLVEQVAVDVVGDGEPYIQSAVTMRIGLDKADLADHDCALSARATAAHSELALGLAGLQGPSDGVWAFAPDAGYPVFAWGATLTRDGAFVCGNQGQALSRQVNLRSSTFEPPLAYRVVPGAP